MKKLESGRSMIEMLGVLAIIGVLSIGGLMGYTMAMNRHRANGVADYISRVYVSAQTQGQGTGTLQGDGLCATLLDSEENAWVTASTCTAARSTDGVTTVTFTVTNSNVASALASRFGSSVTIGETTTTFTYELDDTGNPTLVAGAGG